MGKLVRGMDAYGRYVYGEYVSSDVIRISGVRSDGEGSLIEVREGSLSLLTPWKTGNGVDLYVGDRVRVVTSVTGEMPYNFCRDRFDNDEDPMEHMMGELVFEDGEYNVVYGTGELAGGELLLDRLYEKLSGSGERLILENFKVSRE